MPTTLCTVTLAPGFDLVGDQVGADLVDLLTGSTDDDRLVGMAGDDAVQEAFVIYKPTGQIMWALIDGEGQDPINLQIAGASDVFDLA